MTDQAFYTVFSDALTAPRRDSFVADWSTSSLFLSPEDTAEISPQLVSRLGEIWDVAHLSVAEIRTATGLSQAAFGARFCIPRRTVQNWELRGSCPDYVRLLLAQAAGLFQR